MRPRRILPVFLIMLAALTVAMLPALVHASASYGTPTTNPTASASPSPMILPSLTPTPACSPPASRSTVEWATKWHRQANRNRARLDFVRTCLRLRAVAPLPVRPPRSASESRWTSYGHRCRHLAGRYVRQRARLFSRVLSPHPLVSASQWRPLLTYVGWPAKVVSYAVTIIRRESGGRPGARNPSGCAGLFQLARTWWAGKFDPCRPLPNVRTALAIWRREGWRPWVTAWDAP